MRALCFLIAALAQRVHCDAADWRSDPFLFRSIKIGVCKLFDALEPSGDVVLPDFWRAHANTRLVDTLEAVFGTAPNEVLVRVSRRMEDRYAAAIQSPEAMADYALDSIWQAWSSPSAQEDAKALSDLASHPDTKWMGAPLQDFYYGLLDARKDLAIKGTKS
jgi:hypothetical protein